MAAPAGTLERRRDLALALRALRPEGVLTALAPKDRGGARLAKELAAFGCEVAEASRRHQRICRCPPPLEPGALDAAISAGAPTLPPALGLWSQPGVFSWDRPDPGTSLLLARLPALKGRGADLGCGVGVIAAAVLESPAVTGLELIDIDRRAVGAARRNITDPRARILWADVRTEPLPDGLDFVVCNPPFHEGGAEDRSLGPMFARRAHGALRRGGVLYLVANRHLPYEALLAEMFTETRRLADGGGYKVYEARK